MGKPLSKRELEVLLNVADGMQDKSIAQALHISVSTVGAHLEHIYRKLEISEGNINRRCAAISQAFRRGLVA